MWYKQRRWKSIMDYWIMVILSAVTCFLLMGCCSVATTNLSDECDWTGSGLTSSQHTSSTSRGVTPVYLRCTAGRIRWLYPRGALRILLRLPTHQDREFRACIRLRPDLQHQRKKQQKGHNYQRHRRRHQQRLTSDVVSLDDVMSEEVNGEYTVPARLFLEGPRSLIPLYGVSGAVGDAANIKRTRCFNSKNGQAAIYVEAIPDDNYSKRVADIEYDLQALPRGAKGFDPTEECRPCTTDELAHAFCTSDLVTRGIIGGVENLDELSLSQMTIKVTKVIRNTPTHHLYDNDNSEDSNSYSNDNNLTDDYYLYRTIEGNTAHSDSDSGHVAASSHLPLDEASHVSVHVAQHCGVTHGLGEFVFMARRKLGALTLRCAPRLEDWAPLVHRMNEQGTAHCVLTS